MELRPRRGRSATQPSATPSSSVKTSPKTRAPASTRKKTAASATLVSAAPPPPAENTTNTDFENSFETPLPTATKQSRIRTSTRKVATSTRRGRSASLSQEKEETEAVSGNDVNATGSCLDGYQASEDNGEVPKTIGKSGKAQSSKKVVIKKDDVVDEPVVAEEDSKSGQSKKQTEIEDNDQSHEKDSENNESKDCGNPSSSKESSKKRSKIELSLEIDGEDKIHIEGTDKIGNSMKKGSSKKKSTKKKKRNDLVLHDDEIITANTCNEEYTDTNDENKNDELSDGTNRRLLEDVTDPSLQDDQPNKTIIKGTGRKNTTKQKNKSETSNKKGKVSTTYVEDTMLGTTETNRKLFEDTGNEALVECLQIDRSEENVDPSYNSKKKDGGKRSAKKDSAKKKREADLSLQIDENGGKDAVDIEPTNMDTDKALEDVFSISKGIEKCVEEKNQNLNSMEVDVVCSEAPKAEKELKKKDEACIEAQQDTGFANVYCEDKEDLTEKGVKITLEQKRNENDMEAEGEVRKMKEKKGESNKKSKKEKRNESRPVVFSLEESVEKSTKKEKSTFTVADDSVPFEEASVRDDSACETEKTEVSIIEHNQFCETQKAEEKDSDSSEDEEMARLFAKSMKKYMNSISVHSVSKDYLPKPDLMEGNHTLQGSMHASGSGSSRLNDHELTWRPDTGLTIPQTFEKLLENGKSTSVKANKLWKKESKLQDGLCVPPIDPAKLNKMARKQREDTAGAKWYDLPAQTITPELKKELQLLKLRRVIDPKKHYKADDSKGLPKYFQVGTVVSGPAEFYSGRLTKKEKKASLADELLSDSSINAYRKRKYLEIQEQKQAGGKTFWKKKKFKRTPGWAKM